MKIKDEEIKRRILEASKLDPSILKVKKTTSQQAIKAAGLPPSLLAKIDKKK